MGVDMAKEFYVFANETDANTCIASINASGWFPITGTRAGAPAEDKQKTTSWVTAAQEMTTGEYCIPRIPEDKLDFLGVPQAERNAFMAAFGQDIRTLTKDDFPQVELD